MSTPLTVELIRRAELVRDVDTAVELARFFTNQQRGLDVRDAARSVRDAIYAAVIRSSDGHVIAAATVNPTAPDAFDVVREVGVRGTVRPVHVISHLASVHHGKGFGTQVLETVHAESARMGVELLVAVTSAADHCDGFWAAKGYTLTRRAMPAVLPAEVLGLTGPTPNTSIGFSAGNTVPARFVYREITGHLPRYSADIAPLERAR